MKTAKNTDKTDSLALLEAGWKTVSAHHGPEGHGYIRSHWNRYAWMLGQIPRLGSDSRVLEIGASIIGAVLKNGFGCEVHCAYHPQEPEWAERFRLEGIEGRAVELLRDPLPWTDPTFDLVLLDQVLEHLPVAPHFLLRQIFRCLKPGGQLLLCVPNFARAENRWKLLRGGNPQEPMDTRFVYYAHHFEPVMGECLAWIKDSGGRVLEKEWVDFDAAKGFPGAWLARLKPSTRSYCFVRAEKNPGMDFSPEQLEPPLRRSGEFTSRESSSSS